MRKQALLVAMVFGFTVFASGTAFAHPGGFFHRISHWISQNHQTDSTPILRRLVQRVRENQDGATPVPEPTAALAFGAGLIALGATRRRKS